MIAIFFLIFCEDNFFRENAMNYFFLFLGNFYTTSKCQKGQN